LTAGFEYKERDPIFDVQLRMGLCTNTETSMLTMYMSIKTAVSLSTLLAGLQEGRPAL